MDQSAMEDDSDLQGPAAPQNGEDTPTEAGQRQRTHVPEIGREENRQPRKARKSALVHDAVVNVVLSSQYIESGNVSSDPYQRSLSLDNQVQANMVISIWTMEEQRYFTLSFTSASPTSPPSTTTKQSRTVSRTPTRLSLSTPLDPSPSSSNGSGNRSNCGSLSPSATVTSPANLPLSLAPFPMSGAPARSNMASAPSILQKITRLKDGILNAMEIPVFAMWKDESLALPNKAAARLREQHADSTSDPYTPFPTFKVYTEDFERELQPEEYPLIVLCRTQKPFSNWKIGMKTPRTERHIRCVDIRHCCVRLLTVTQLRC